MSPRSDTAARTPAHSRRSDDVLCLAAQFRHIGHLRQQGRLSTRDVVPGGADAAVATFAAVSPVRRRGIRGLCRRRRRRVRGPEVRRRSTDRSSRSSPLSPTTAGRSRSASRLTPAVGWRPFPLPFGWSPSAPRSWTHSSCCDCDCPSSPAAPPFHSELRWRIDCRLTLVSSNSTRSPARYRPPSYRQRTTSCRPSVLLLGPRCSVRAFRGGRGLRLSCGRRRGRLLRALTGRRAAIRAALVPVCWTPLSACCVVPVT